MADDALLSAVRSLKLEQPNATAKEVHQALTTAGHAVEFSEVKKACSKVAKSLASEPAPTAAAPAEQPTLVTAPPGSVAFLRCQQCEKRLTKPRVCAGCMCVSYCGNACRAADAEHTAECESYARHLKRDVSVAHAGRCRRAERRPRRRRLQRSLARDAAPHPPARDPVCLLGLFGAVGRKGAGPRRRPLRHAAVDRRLPQPVPRPAAAAAGARRRGRLPHAVERLPGRLSHAAGVAGWLTLGDSGT